MFAKFRIVVLLFFVFLFNNIHGQLPSNIRQFTLDNGFTVILIEDHSRPDVFGEIVVKAGSKHDPSDATGLAHYQEHMLFKGTEEIGTIDWQKEKIHIDKIFQLYDQLGATKDETERKKIQQQINEESLKANEYAIPNELSNIIKATGGTNLNANTSPDRTVYFNKFPSSEIYKWLELYSHRFISPVFRGFQSELEVVYEEKNMYSDMFQFSLIEEFNKQLFKKHPYGQQTTIGTVDHLKNPSLTKMYNFFKTYYVANNMGLILSGDIYPDEIIPIIKEKFGRLAKGDIPAFKNFSEEPFKGREFVEMRLSPIKIAMLGFMTVPENHPDNSALEVCNNILSNRNQTGLLDKLTLENKLLAVMLFPFQYYDYAATVFFVIPKILGQKLENAEQLVLSEITKVRNGEFDEASIEAAKNQKYREFQLQLESTDNKALMIAEYFAQGMAIENLFKQPEEIKKVTREDIVRVANKYYGQNYLAFFSKMGFPKKQKMEKPGYKPVLSNTEAKSSYVKSLEQIKSRQFEPSFIDFNKAFTIKNITSGVVLYATQNPANDIFSMDLKYGIGDIKMPKLKYATQIMNFSGVKGKNVADFKKEFAKIGCSYSVSSDESYMTISLEGIEENLKKALALLNDLMINPELEKNKLEVIVQGEMTNRKMEKSEIRNLSDALDSYVKLGEMSPFLNRLSLKEITKLNSDSLVSCFRNALNYECEIHYCGKLAADEVSAYIGEAVYLPKQTLKSESPFNYDYKTYSEKAVYFVNKKNALQSNISLFANVHKFNIEEHAFLDAFNLYFGGDFSGLVLQEIREYRSLAYGAGARLSIPARKDKNVLFSGFVSTQSDKTTEAISVFDSLVYFMPQKAERIDMIKQYLQLSAFTNRPDFRNISESVVRWKHIGYNEDPLKSKLEKYKSLTFNDIVNFYNTTLKPKHVVYTIAGNKKRINFDELKKYGKLVTIKEKQLFK